MRVILISKNDRPVWLGNAVKTFYENENVFCGNSNYAEVKFLLAHSFIATLFTYVSVVRVGLSMQCM